MAHVLKYLSDLTFKNIFHVNIMVIGYLFFFQVSRQSLGGAENRTVASRFLPCLFPIFSLLFLSSSTSQLCRFSLVTSFCLYMHLSLRINETLVLIQINVTQSNITQNTSLVCCRVCLGIYQKTNTEDKEWSCQVNRVCE